MILPLTLGFLVFIIALIRRELGVVACLLLLPAYLVRTTIIGVPTTGLELSISALVVAWLIRDVLPRRLLTWPKLSRKLLVLVAAWVLAWTLATVFSTDRQASLGAFKAWLVDPLLFGLVVVSTSVSLQRHQVVLSGLAGSGLLVSLYGLYQYFFQHATLQDGRLSSFFHPVANYAAMFLAPIIIVTLGALMWKRIHRWWWAAVAVMLVALALTVSFGGFLSVGIGALLLLWRWPNRRQQLLFFVIVAVVAIFGIVAVAKTPYLAEKFNTSDRSSSLVRTQIWRTSVEMIRERPWFGVGPNAYEAIYRETIPKLYWPPLEWLVSQPHQLWLALWLETGLLGLITFVLFACWWTKTLWSRLQLREPLAVIAIAAMASLLVHGLVDTPLFKNDLMVLFLVVALIPFLDKQKTN